MTSKYKQLRDKGNALLRADGKTWRIRHVVEAHTKVELEQRLREARNHTLIVQRMRVVEGPLCEGETLDVEGILFMGVPGVIWTRAGERQPQWVHDWERGVIADFKDLSSAADREFMTNPWVPIGDLPNEITFDHCSFTDNLT